MARNDALPNAPVLGGGAFAAYAWAFGARASAGIGLTRASVVGDAEARSGLGAFALDVDVTLTPSRASGAIARRLHDFVPFALAGVGVGGVRPVDGAMRARPAWSLGAGLAFRLLGGLSMSGEVRHRMPLGADASAAGFRAGEEYRFALALDFGGRELPRSAPSRPRAQPGSTAAPSATAAEPPLPPGARVAAHDAATPARPALSTAAAVGPATAPALARGVIATAERYLGESYKYGGATPAVGFDCSGFVQFVFAQHDVHLPRTARRIAQTGARVSARPDSLRPGDLLFFATTGRRVDHVALYVGRGRIIHSTSTGGGVRHDELDTPRGKWFLRRLVSVRRVLEGDQPGGRRPPVAADADALDPPDRAPVP